MTKHDALTLWVALVKRLCSTPANTPKWDRLQRYFNELENAFPSLTLGDLKEYTEKNRRAYRTAPLYRSAS
jgi:hypothetical protein